jgi:hypothetical protein
MFKVNLWFVINQENELDGLKSLSWIMKFEKPPLLSNYSHLEKINHCKFVSNFDVLRTLWSEYFIK